MRPIHSLFLVLALGAASASASAQVTDPNMSCADYLKLAASVGPSPKTGNAEADKMAADIETKMKAYCTANPAAKAMDAAQKVLMGG